MAEAINPHIIYDNLRNPNLEDLSIFAELKVTRRSRLLNNVGSGENITISFMGHTDGTFTTDWTNNEENFGIRNINITMTSSYVPQVDITFEDVRGQALFANVGDSKYRGIFDMPPPIFDLTVKGFYGQKVTYRLHLLKQTTSFVDGSFIIDASFVGMTFAPLGDMFIDYVQVAPYLSGKADSTDTFIKLITETKKMVTAIKSTVKQNEQEITKVTEKLENLKELNNDLLGTLEGKINTFIKQKDASDYITVKGSKENVNISNNNSLKVYFNKKNNINSHYDDEETNLGLYNDLTTIVGNFRDNINNNGLISKVKIDEFIDYNDIGVGEELVYTFTLPGGNKQINNDIKRKITSYEDEIEKLKSEIVEDKHMVMTSYDLQPTLYTILRVILSDANTFFKLLQDVVKRVEEERSGNEDDSMGEAEKYPFPNYYEDREVDGKTVKVKSIPKGEKYNSWPEIIFINNYIEAKLNSTALIESSGINYDTINNLEAYKYVPINPFDGILNSEVPNRYNYNVYGGSSNDRDILNKLVQRAAILINYSLHSKAYEKYIITEAENIISAIRDNETLFNVLFNRIGNSNFALDSISEYGKYKDSGTIDTNINGVDYNETTIRIKSVEDFPQAFGAPTIVNDSNLNIENSSISYWRTSYISQYNVLLYVDSKFVINDMITTTFRNRSEFVDGKVFDFEKDKDFLSNVSGLPELLNNIRISVNPAQYIGVDQLLGATRHAGIYAVPLFVILGWYVKENLNDVVKPHFKEIYDEFNDRWLNNTNSIKSSFRELIKNYQDSDDEIDVMSSQFITELTELKYIIIGNKNIFREEEPSMVYDEEVTIFLNKTIRELNRLKGITKKEKNDKRIEYNTSVENHDIKTQLYYTFKSFVDKWIINTPLDVNNMFSIDNFLMVDRGFNNIGEDVIIDMEPIFATEFQADTSIYTLLLNLLNKNNFQFFSLPAYIDYSERGLLWSETNINKVFGTSTIMDTKETNPKFICMYVGGTSSILDIKDDNGFNDDSGPVENINGLNDVQAFKVDIGGGTQSIFNSVNLDQIEFKETSESIILLDRIAKSGSNPTETASNSLFNVYEQRSYTATVTMMGCVMIQPTMYFELSIPMFKGTYLILEVNHTIDNNSMITTFKGVRVPKVAKPYVNDMSIMINGVNTDGTRYGNPNIRVGNNNAESAIGGITTNMTNEEKAFLDMLAYAEGTTHIGNNNGYDVLNGGDIIKGWTRQNPGLHPGSKASGRYQILGMSWGDKDKAFGVYEQDNWAVNKVRSSFRPKGLDLRNATLNTFKNYIDCVANTWASLPYYKSFGLKPTFMYWKEGDSFYGDSNNGRGGKSQRPRDRNSISQLWEVYNGALKIYKGIDVNMSNLKSKQIKELQTLKKEAQVKFSDFIRAIERETGYGVLITSSYRSVPEQYNEKYIKGNSKAAEPGLSLHNYGLAIDINLTLRGVVKISMNSNKNVWENTGVPTIARRMNLEWGGEYNDNVHFQMNYKNGDRIRSGVLRDRGIELFGDISNPDFDGRKVDLYV